MKYAWINEHRDSFPISTMCRVLQVSTSGFYRCIAHRAFAQSEAIRSRPRSGKSSNNPRESTGATRSLISSNQMTDWNQLVATQLLLP